MKSSFADKILNFLKISAGPLIIITVLLIIYILLRALLRNRTVFSSFLKKLADKSSDILGKIIKKVGINRLLRFSGNRMSHGKGVYDEEREKIIQWRHLGKNYAEQLKEWLARMTEREQKWSDLKTNSERVRFLYRKMIINAIVKGYEFKSYNTARETIHDLFEFAKEPAKSTEEEINVRIEADEASSIYEKIRYGKTTIDIDDETLDKVKKYFHI